MVNKQGQTRLAQYYEYLTLEERRALEGEIVRKCLARNEQQVSLSLSLSLSLIRIWFDESLLLCSLLKIFGNWLCPKSISRSYFIFE